MVHDMIETKKMKKERVLPPFNLSLPPPIPQWGPSGRAKLKGVTRSFFIFFVSILLCSSLLFAQTVTVPHLINFQSVVSNAGGVPLADGIHSIRFRLLDASQKSLYDETQSLESLSGVVSAMIGSKVDLSPALLVPGQAKFLGVTAEGASTETLLEIVSTPYALYAEQALQVAPKSIGKEAIIPKSITADLLADDVLQGLLPANFVTPSQLEVLKGDYRSAFGAGRIGVDTNFVYSRGPTVQGVLKDLDTALYQRQVNLDKQNSDLTQTINTNISGLRNQITSQKTDLIQIMNANSASLQSQMTTQKTDLQGKINTTNSNVTALQGTSSSLQTQINTVNTSLATNVSQLSAADANLQGQINTITSNLATKSYVDSKIAALPGPALPSPSVASPSAGHPATFVRFRDNGNIQIVSQYNVSSVVLEVTGGGADRHYVITFTTPLADDNYGVIPLQERLDASMTYLLPTPVYYRNRTTSSVIVNAAGAGSGDFVVQIISST